MSTLAEPARRNSSTGRPLQEVVVTARAEAPPAAVWALLADVTTWPDWAPFDEARYLAAGAPDPHGVGAVRLLRAGRLHGRETVERFEPLKRLSYSYVGSLPVKDYRADVTLSPDGAGTLITWRAHFRMKLPLTGWLLRPLVRKVLKDVASALAGAAAAQRSSS